MSKKILIIFIIYCFYLFLMFIFQRSLIYPGKYISASNYTLPDSKIKRIWFSTSAGKVEAWYSPVNNLKNKEKRPAVIFAHGNYELIDYCYREAKLYNKLGVNVLLVEYPGYGRSEGSPSQGSINDVFIQAYDWLVENPEIDKKKIIAHGRSLGGGPVSFLTSKRDIRALILQSTFTDLSQFAWRYLAPPFLVRDPFDNLSMIRSFKGPVLIFHGKHDDIIPYENGLKLSQNSKKGKLVTLNCKHNDCPIYDDEFWVHIKRFLEFL